MALIGLFGVALIFLGIPGIIILFVVLIGIGAKTANTETRKAVNKVLYGNENGD